MGVLRPREHVVTKRVVSAGRMFLLALAAALVAWPAAAADPTFGTPGPCVTGDLPDGARSMTCVPDAGWNGSLVVFAHGYVPVNEELQFANLRLTDGTSLPTLVQRLGFAFATTTYRQNGLAVLEGTADIANLVKAFRETHGEPVRTYLTGASEGGLVAVLAAEQHPDLFTGAYALCGPIGAFPLQVNYIGDFRVLFDYYFPGVLPGEAITIPPDAMANWASVHAPAITNAVMGNPGRARELLRVARAPFDPGDPTTIVGTTVGLLWYNVFATNDAKAKLGGNPYDNRLRWYSGSANDAALNRRVRRHAADAAAVSNLRRYSPSGDLRIPLVSLHTTADEIVPYSHEVIYAARVQPRDGGRFLPLPVLRYGHCNFTTSQVLAGFALMLR